VFVANVLTSCLAWVVDDPTALEALAPWVGVAGTATFARVPTPGTKEERDGVKGAEVGTIREEGFGVDSSRNECSGWACGSPRPGGAKPGGTDGVEDREANPKGSNGRNPISSAVLSATSASTDRDASSRDGRSWSSERIC